jgi:hypothetical protein
MIAKAQRLVYNVSSKQTEEFPVPDEYGPAEWRKPVRRIDKIFITKSKRSQTDAAKAQIFAQLLTLELDEEVRLPSFSSSFEVSCLRQLNDQSHRGVDGREFWESFFCTENK